MAEEGDNGMIHDEQSSQKHGGNSGHIAALIVQRAFLRSRLRKARAERLCVEAIAERLVRADADMPHGHGSRCGLQLTNQLSSNSGQPHGVSKRANGPPGIAWGTLLMRSQTRRVLFKRPGKTTDSRHPDAAQICQRLQTVAGPQQETSQAEIVVDSPRLAGSPPTPTSDSRFSRASAAHQLTPYRPRRSSRTPPSLLQSQTQPQETAENNTSDIVRPKLPSAEGSDEDVATKRASLVVAQASPAATTCQGPESSSTNRCCPGSATPRGAAEDPALATAPHVAPSSDVFESPMSCRTPAEDDASPSGSPLPALAGYGSPRVGLQVQSTSAFGLSPFPEGTPPLPSKLVAKAAEEMDAWRGEVQQMRAELTKTYRSICKLQSILWESPSARRLISPATLRQKRSPYRALRHTKLPPSPLSRGTVPQHGTSATLEPTVDSLSLNSKLDARELKLRRKEEETKESELEGIERLDSGANASEAPSGDGIGEGAFKRAGLVPGVFYLGTADGGVPAARSLDMGGVNTAVPEPGVSEEDVPDRGSSDTGASDRELPAQRRLFEMPASIQGGRNGRPAGPQENEGEPHGRRDDPSGEAGPHVYDPASWDEDATSSGGRNLGTHVGRGQASGQGAPLGIMGFLQGLFSPVGTAKKGRDSAEATSMSGGENEGASWGSGSDEETRDGGRNASASGRTEEAAAAAEPDTWHDASDEVLFEHTPNGASPSYSPRLSKTRPAEERADRPQSSPTSSPSRRRRTAVRSPVRSIAAVHLPPLTSSYSTTPPALAPPAPFVFSPPRAPPQSSQTRNRVLVDRSHNESDEPVVPSKPDAWAAPPTPFRVDSENVPGNLGLSEQSKSRIKRTVGSRSVAERGLLSSFYRAGVGSRPLPPVTRDVLCQKASTKHLRPGLNPGAETRAATRDDSTPINGEAVLEEGRHVKWWDAVEEEDKENGVAGKRPKERSPRYSPKHMSATPSKSILKQGVPVGPRSLAHARDIRLRKLQAQAALAPKLTGRALRIKGRYI